jgi:beta-mannosidase
MEHAAQAHTVAARGTLTLSVADWFDTLLDLSRAYRFGPAEHSLVVATLRSVGGATLAQAFHFPEGLPTLRERNIELSAHAHRHDDGSAQLTVKTARFAQSVHFDLPDFVAQDEYFHLAPGSERTVQLKPLHAGARPAIAGRVAALNSHATAPVLELQP